MICSSTRRTPAMFSAAMRNARLSSSDWSLESQKCTTPPLTIMSAAQILNHSRALNHSSQCGHPRKSNPLVVEQLDQPLFLERRKGPTYGFGGKAEIIGDVAAAHCQEHRVARPAVPNR